MTEESNPDAELMPLNQNINLVQLVGAVATIAAVWGIKLSPAVQESIVTVSVAVVAIVTWYLHTYVNHPRNVARAVAAVRAAAPGNGIAQ